MTNNILLKPEHEVKRLAHEMVDYLFQEFFVKSIKQEKEDGKHILIFNTESKENKPASLTKRDIDDLFAEYKERHCSDVAPPFDYHDYANGFKEYIKTEMFDTSNQTKIDGDE